MLLKIEKAKQSRASMALEAQNIPSGTFIPGNTVCQFSQFILCVCVCVCVVFSHLSVLVSNINRHWEVLK